MAIQVSAIETSEGIGLHFTKVLDVQPLGRVDEEEEVAEKTDRDYWLNKRGTPRTVAMADKLLSYVVELDPDAELNYNKFYIGLKINGRSKNYAIFRPKKSFISVEIKVAQTEENDELINQAEITTLDYDKRYGAYRLRINEKELEEKAETIKKLLKAAQQTFR
tara:strand:- start:175 stop:666 length:492 start_codon:yes stop_codon:yes gene_type:complete